MLGRVLLGAALAVAPAAMASAQAPASDSTPQSPQSVAAIELEAGRNPEDADVLRRLAVAQAAAGDLSAARATIDRAATLAPADNDIRLARARIMLWSGHTEEARAQAEAVRTTAPDYPELAELIAQIDNAEPHGSGGGFSLYGGYTRVNFEAGGSASWHSAGGSLYAPIGDRSILTGAVEFEKRAVADTRLGVRLDRQIAHGSAYVAATMTPSADFRERWSVSGGIEREVVAALDLLLEAKHAHYTGNDVTSLQPGLRWRATNRVSFTARWISLFQSEGGYRAGASARADFSLPGDNLLFAGAATYPDTEAGVTRRVWGGFAGFAIPVAERFTLRGSAEYEARDQSYTRKAVTLGVGWRFGG